MRMSSENPVWVAVDGGGTKTHMSVCDSQKRILFDKVFGSTNYKAYSKEEVHAAMAGAWQEMRETLSIGSDAVRGAVIAVSGCDSRQDEAFYRDLMTEIGMPPRRTLVCNDTEGIYRGMTNEKGICLVAGTGAIACAYDEEKQIARAGGWGAPLSDIGSGYWIGSQILQRYLLWLDGFDVPDDPVFPS